MQPMAVTYLYLHLCAVLYLYLRCTVFVFVAANDDGEGSVELCLCPHLSKSGHSIAMHCGSHYNVNVLLHINM